MLPLCSFGKDAVEFAYLQFYFIICDFLVINLLNERVYSKEHLYIAYFDLVIIRDECEGGGLYSLVFP